MKKRDKTEGSSVYINRGTERTRNRFFWRKGDVYENTYGHVCRVRDAHLFLRWGARRTEGHHSYYQRLKPVYEAYQRAKDKAAFRSSHEAELVIFEAARSTLLAIQACKEKVKPQMGLAARKFGRRCGERSAAQISHHKVPA